MAPKKRKSAGGRPRKPPESSKNHLLQVRLEESERDGFAAAAKLNGLDVSAWVRTTLRAAARKELRGNGESVPFLEK